MLRLKKIQYSNAPNYPAIFADEVIVEFMRDVKLNKIAAAVKPDEKPDEFKL